MPLEFISFIEISVFYQKSTWLIFFNKLPIFGRLIIKEMSDHVLLIYVSSSSKTVKTWSKTEL